MTYKQIIRNKLWNT